jgi:hypothetical protein
LTIVGEERLGGKIDGEREEREKKLESFEY